MREDPRLLERVQVNHPPYRLLQVQIFRVAGDADDLVRLILRRPPIILPLEGEELSDGAATAEVVSRHRLAHDRHQRASLVFEREIAPCQQWRAERFEVLRRGPVQRHAPAVLRLFPKPRHVDEP